MSEASSAGAAQVLLGDGPVRLILYDDGVAELRLCRPEAANGLDMAMLQALNQAVLLLHGDDRVRAVLLVGEGRNFCAGGDIHTFLAQGEALPAYIRKATALLQAVTAGLIRLNPPVVAAVQGYAAGGGGMGLICSADFVVAAQSSAFLAGATRVGMVPDAGVSVTLSQLVGLRRAMDILMLNPVIPAAEALQLGLVSRVVADHKLEEEARVLAGRLAAGPPLALAQTKRLLWSGLGRGVEAAMPDENQVQAMLAGTADAHEGMRAVIEKRTPRFEGR